ncbi:hypothetical protein V1508DRAFT_424790, partial [Lipomyces doorenjongii]|uniref:uncharacterized protein n=1 Tax=Lipomyces doorenjongii TaxID=383834 RepID=UPI0034CD5830
MTLYPLLNLLPKFSQAMLTAMPPKSWAWEHFHTTRLETTYIHKATNKSRSDMLIVCTRCSWSTTEAVLQGSSGNLSTHLSSRHGILKNPGTPAPRTSSDITRSVQERLEENILHWIAQTFQRIFHDLP